MRGTINSRSLTHRRAAELEPAAAGSRQRPISSSAYALETHDCLQYVTNNRSTARSWSLARALFSRRVLPLAHLCSLLASARFARGKLASSGSNRLFRLSLNPSSDGRCVRGNTPKKPRNHRDQFLGGRTTRVLPRTTHLSHSRARGE